ncbi:MAG TPA: hypothetical protein VGD71_39750, partial [Kribbella sp.]
GHTPRSGWPGKVWPHPSEAGLRPVNMFATPDHRRARSDHGRRRVATRTNARVARVESVTTPSRSGTPYSLGVSHFSLAKRAPDRIVPVVEQFLTEQSH